MTDQEIVADIRTQVQQAYIDSGESNTDYLCIMGRLKNNDGDVVSAYKSVRYFHAYGFNAGTKAVLDDIIAKYCIPNDNELDKMRDAQIDAEVKARQDRATANVEARMALNDKRNTLDHNFGYIAIGGLAFLATFFLTWMMGNMKYTADLSKKYLEGD